MIDLTSIPHAQHDLEGNLTGGFDAAVLRFYDKKDNCVPFTINARPPCLLLEEFDEEEGPAQGLMKPVISIQLTKKQAEQINRLFGHMHYRYEPDGTTVD